MSYLGVSTSQMGENMRKGGKRQKAVDYYVLMYEHGKMRYVETISSMKGGLELRRTLMG
jgi:hypothetical protein